MIEVGQTTIPLVEAWRRFSLGNATKADFQVILTDMLEVSHHGQAVSFGAFLAEQKSLDNYTLYCALVAAKQEIGKRVVTLLNYTEEEIIEAKRLARSTVKRSLTD